MQAEQFASASCAGRGEILRGHLSGEARAAWGTRLPLCHCPLPSSSAPGGPSKSGGEEAPLIGGVCLAMSVGLQKGENGEGASNAMVKEQHLPLGSRVRLRPRGGGMGPLAPLLEIQCQAAGAEPARGVCKTLYFTFDILFRSIWIP